MREPIRIPAHGPRRLLGALALAVPLVVVAVWLAACGSSSSTRASSASPSSLAMSGAFVHPNVSNVTWCWNCHPSVFAQWQASTPYKTAAYGALRGHNVNMRESLTDSSHNTDEPLVNDCVQCHSPFTARHQNGVTVTKIGELVQPVNQVGSPKGSWHLIPPYTNLSTLPADFYFPADNPTDTNHAAWEGISCRVCHDTSHLTTLADGSQVPTLAFFNPGAAVDPTLPAYAYTSVPLLDVGRPNVTWLCDRCHQPNGDDTRNATPASVHAGLNCLACHGQVDKMAGDAFNHDLNAGQAGAPIAQTSCARCHSGPNAVDKGHPDVTKLQTSLLNHGLYAADPAGDLQVNAVKWHNIHYVTCDTCHQPTLTKTSYVVASGSPLTIVGTRPRQNLQNLPNDADSGVVSLWTLPAGSKDGTRVASSSSGAPGSSFVINNFRPTKSMTLFVTQALPLVPSPSNSVITMTFPGLGRGVEIHVTVKP